MPRTASAIYSIVIRAAAVVVVAGLLFFLAVKAVAPTGSLSVTTDLVRPSPFISEPKPSERLAAAAADDSGRTLAPLVDSPLYLDLTPPSAFDAVTMTVRFTNRNGALVELGALASSIDEQFDPRPAAAPLLDSLDWTRVSSGDLTLLERDRRFASVDEFFRQPPDPKQVAVYRARFDVPFSLPGYRPAGQPREIDVSLRGRHRLLTYVQGEPLNFTFYLQDMNRQAGADPVIVSVYRLGAAEPIARTILEDDGDTADDQHSSKLRAAAISVTDPPDGVYQIELTADDDVFVRRIVTGQSKVVFQDRVYLGDQVGYSDDLRPVTVFTGGQELQARTPHLESVQTLRVAGRPLEISEPQTKYVRRLPAGAGLTPVVSTRHDVLLETDGLFAFAAGDYFDPLPLTVSWYTTAADLKALGVGYILTTYEPPENDGGLDQASATFDAAKLARTEDGAYRFAILAPGISEEPRDLRLASVTFTLDREPLSWRNALSRLVRLFTPPAAGEPLVLPNGASYEESPP